MQAAATHSRAKGVPSSWKGKQDPRLPTSGPMGEAEVSHRRLHLHMHQHFRRGHLPVTTCPPKIVAQGLAGEKREISLLFGGSAARGLAIQHLHPPEKPLSSPTPSPRAAGLKNRGREEAPCRPGRRRARRHPPRGVGSLTLGSGRLKTLGSSVLPTMILCSLPGPGPPAPSARAALAPWRSPAARSLAVLPMAAARVGGHLSWGTVPGGEHPGGASGAPPAPPLRRGFRFRESPPRGLPSRGRFPRGPRGMPRPLPARPPRSPAAPPLGNPAAGNSQASPRSRPRPAPLAPLPARDATRSLLPGRPRDGCSEGEAT